MKSVSNGSTYLASADHSKVVSSSLSLKDAVSNVMDGCESSLRYSHTNTQLSHLRNITDRSAHEEARPFTGCEEPKLHSAFTATENR